MEIMIILCENQRVVVEPSRPRWSVAYNPPSMNMPAKATFWDVVRCSRKMTDNIADLVNIVPDLEPH